MHPQSICMTSSCVCSQEQGHISIIEQSELYAPNSDPSQDILNPHKDCRFLSKLNDPAHLCRKEEGSEPIIRSLASANVPRQLMDSVLHGREMGMHQLPGSVKTLLHRNQADDFKVKLRKSLEDGTWGLPNMVDPESVVMSPPLFPAQSPPSSSLSGAVPSPTPTVQSTLSSAGMPPFTGNQLPLDSTQTLADRAHFGSDQHTISYYSSSSTASSPPSTLHAPPTSVPSPTHSRLQSYVDTRSPSNSYSAVSSPASTVGVVSSLSPASSFMSSATSLQRALKRKAASSFNSGESTDFSLRAPDAAIASTFGNTSTNFLPNFSHVPFQNSQIPIPQLTQYSSPLPQTTPLLSISGGNNSELDQILDCFDSVPNTHVQHQNGNDVLQHLLNEPSQMSPEAISYYDTGASKGHKISGDVTVSTGCPGSVEQPNGAEVMEILSQFS